MRQPRKKKKKRMDVQAALFYDLELSSITADINWGYGIWTLHHQEQRTYFWVGWPTQLVYCALSIKFSNQTFKEIHLKELTFFLPKLPNCCQADFLQIYEEGNIYQWSPLVQYYVQLAVGLGCFIQATRKPFTATTLLFFVFTTALLWSFHEVQTRK